MKKWIATLATAAALLPLSSFAAYPERPMTWIVPFAAGGPTDAMARNIANRLSQELGETIVIENAPGAGGTIGSAKAARATADGYTFLVGHIGYMAAAPSLYSNLRYDPVKDFEAVFRFPDTPLVLLTGENSEFKTAQDLIEHAKKNPGTLDFGTAGVGSTSHLVAAMFAANAGIDIQTIAYRGAGPALNDLMGGQVHAMFDQTNTALPQTSGGKVKALGLTSADRMSQFPNVPTMKEGAIPGFQVSTWYGLYAPKGTPQEVVKTLFEAYTRIMKDTSFTDKMVDQGILLLSDEQYSPEVFQKYTVDEGVRWKEVIDKAGIKLD